MVLKTFFAEFGVDFFFNERITGVPRQTEKEKEAADFDIFDDPETPYSTFNFQYSNKAFTQLHDLMEFNTLNNIETIKEAIKDSIVYRKDNPSRFSVSLSLSDIQNKRFLNRENRAKTNMMAGKLKDQM